MPKLAIVATFKVAPEKRNEYLTHMKAHAERCRATEPGTLQFDILIPRDEPDAVMLYEVYASDDAFQVHWNGPSIQQFREDAKGIEASLKGQRCDLVE